jgi:hypothetical protein
MCRSLADGGRRCTHHSAPARRSTEARSREHFRRKTRETGAPGPFDELDAAVERWREWVAAVDSWVAGLAEEMRDSGISAADIEAVTAARKTLFRAHALTQLAVFERTWTAATFTKGRGVKTKNAEAADRETDARQALHNAHAAYVETMAAVGSRYRRDGENLDLAARRHNLSDDWAEIAFARTLPSRGWLDRFALLAVRSAPAA